MGDSEDVLKNIKKKIRTFETKEGMLLGKRRFLLEEQLDKDSDTSGKSITKIFKARDLRLDEIVAVKCVRYGPHLDDEAIERFKREAEVLSEYHHPNVVNLRYYDKTERHLFYVMDYIEGEDLFYLLKARRRLSIGRSVRMAIKIADALSGMHEKGIIHRDVKPENIMVTNIGKRNENYILIDLGIVKLKYQWDPGLTALGEFLGTIPFVSPEQIKNMLVDERSDIYSLGTVLYNVISGRTPFERKEGETNLRLIKRILEAEPPQLIDLNPNTPGQLNEYVMKCIAKDPDERFQTCYGLISALKDFLRTFKSYD